MLSVDVSSALIVLVIEDLLVVKVFLVVGKELLSVTVVKCVFVVVSKGVVAEVRVIIGVGELIVWVLAVVGFILFVVPVIEEIRVLGVVSVVGTEEEAVAMVVVIFSEVVVVGEVIMAEVTLSAVVAG